MHLQRGLGRAFALLLASAGALAKPVPTDTDPLFAGDEVLAITLRGPFAKMAQDRSPEPEEQPGTLAYVDANGQERTFDVQIRPRGKSRRDRLVCTFPPLRLNFKTKALTGTLLEGQDKLKLVTHCRSTASFQNFVLKEYLVYRLMNVLTESSFRARLLKITYQESDAGKGSSERYGFVIEHKNRLAKRLGLRVHEPLERIAVSSLAPPEAALAELYQYLVSNTDFSFIAPPIDDKCCHNAILLAGHPAGYVPVPYDFDRTGLVDPPNGQPAESLGQRTFRDRVYRGFCHPEPAIDNAIEATRAARADLLGLVENQVDLAKSHKVKALKFVESYYQIVDDQKRRERGIKCRSIP